MCAARRNGDKLFRLDGGYGALVRWYMDHSNADLRFRAEVHSIEWQSRRAKVGFVHDSLKQTVVARAVVVTVPLPWLQAERPHSALQFVPDVPAKRSAARRLAMGHVVRVSFVLSQPIWEDIVPNLAFVFCPTKPFPTWWTGRSNTANIITGWVGGPAASTLLLQDREHILTIARKTLAEVAHITTDQIDRHLTASYFHDWSHDHFALGAYSYTPVDALDARAELARPVSDTLFFAGEATNSKGEHGTVHGAEESGTRVASEVAEALR